MERGAMSEENGLLQGVRVIDLTRILAGPYCTMILGDLGADVIKVEHPLRGDDTRQWGPPFAEGGQSAYFISANRNKRSLSLNLKTERGLEILKQLIHEGDVLVENFKVGTLERLGLDEQSLKDINPGLIYCTITGYGYTGPYKDRPGYDFMAQALGGFMSINGPVEGEAYRAGIAIADLSAGIFASNAILASLYHNSRKESWQRIDISLLDSMVALTSYAASNYLVSDEIPQRLGNAHPNIVPYQTFKARDGYFAMAIGNDGQWKTFCEAIDKPDWIEDSRFKTNPDRVANRKVLTAMLEHVFEKNSIAEWLATFEKNDLPAAPINTIDQVFQNPQVQARNLQLTIQHPLAGTIPLLGSPLKIPTNPTQMRLPPPLLGEHTDQLLQELFDYEAQVLENLHEQGVL